VRLLNLVEQFKDIGVEQVPKVKKKQKTTREDRAREIYTRHKNAMLNGGVPIIVRTTKNTIGITSFTRPEHSTIEYKFGQWVCDCPDARMRGRLCKHNIAIILCRMNGVKIPTIDEAMEMTE